jgi:hypothetical protein
MKVQSISAKLDHVLRLLKGDHTCLTSDDRQALGRVSSAIQTLKAKTAAIELDPPKPQHITVQGDKQP